MGVYISTIHMVPPPQHAKLSQPCVCMSEAASGWNADLHLVARKSSFQSICRCPWFLWSSSITLNAKLILATSGLSHIRYKESVRKRKIGKNGWLFRLRHRADGVMFNARWTVYEWGLMIKIDIDDSCSVVNLWKFKDLGDLKRACKRHQVG